MSYRTASGLSIDNTLNFSIIVSICLVFLNERFHDNLDMDDAHFVTMAYVDFHLGVVVS